MAQHRAGESAIGAMKQLKPTDRYPLRELWDEGAQRYTSDLDEMASVILKAANDRQGTARPETTAGQDLLDKWGVDLSSCRKKCLGPKINE